MDERVVTRYAVTFLTLFVTLFLGRQTRFRPFTVWLLFTLMYPPGVSTRRFIMGRTLFLLMLFVDVR